MLQQLYSILSFSFYLLCETDCRVFPDVIIPILQAASFLLPYIQLGHIHIYLCIHEIPYTNIYILLLCIYMTIIMLQVLHSMIDTYNAIRVIRYRVLILSDIQMEIGFHLRDDGEDHLYTYNIFANSFTKCYQLF